MKVMSPEKCVEILWQYRDVIWNSEAKLQLILEYFEELADGGTEREFRNLSLLSRGISVICSEIIADFEKCDIEVIADEMELFSLDPLKVKERVAYRRSIGICTETPEIEIVGPDKPIEGRKLGDV